MSTTSLRKFNEANQQSETNETKDYQTFEPPVEEKNDSNFQIIEPEEKQNGGGYFPGYPKIVFLIILNEFCERFSFYGLKTVLYIYFTGFIKLDKNTATVIYHGYSMLCYFTPIIGLN
jgi:hypothetical protein